MATNGKTMSDKDLAMRLANAQAASGGKSISDADLQLALKKVSGSPTDTAAQKEARRNSILRMISELEKVDRASPHQGMQYGGMAEMSAAPMIQPKKKKKKQSGFRTKYSKGGGVRAAKYKV